MGVFDGQGVNQAVTNAAFIDAQVDSTGFGKVTLSNPDALSGSIVGNVQRELNALVSFLGSSLNAVKDILPFWTNNGVGASTDTIKARAEALTLSLSTHEANVSNPHATTAAQVGIHSTSDISEGTNLYYTDARADARITIQKGVASGLATLDGSGKVPASELPAVSPLTAKGDLYGFDTANQRIPVGPNGQVLTADSTQALGVKWSPSSGGGGGGINYIGLDASYAGTNPDDKNAENSLGQWAAYNNTVAGVSPDAGMTGGTPSGNVLLTRTTAAGQVLDGIASFLITKGAFNVQGEGFSVIANVPPAFRTQSTTISIPFKVISGNYVQGDLKVFLYDVTNSQVITPFNNDVVGSQGVITAIAALNSTTAQIRMGFHFASTSASALTIAFDDVSVGPNQAAMGMAGSNVKSDLTFIPAPAFGATTAASYFYRRVGDSMEVRGTFAAGVIAASTAYIQLPAGYTIDLSKMSSAQNNLVGHHANLTATVVARHMFVDGVTNNQVFFDFGGTPGSYAKMTATTLYSNNDVATFSFTVPIAGFDANVTMAQSSTFKISSFLANGTRVVGVAPQNLGEYRSYLRNAGTQTWSETNGTPTVLPTSSDGIKISTIATYAGADPTGAPSKYEIFVGKNKNASVQFYMSAGRTGFISVGQFSDGTASYSAGLLQSYDPTTGILSITQNTTFGYVNLITGTTAAGGTILSAYFDITVSENALSVGVQAPRSEIRASGTTTNGSIGVRVRVFTTATTTGTAVQYISDSVNGDSFKTLEDGNYSVSFSGAPNSFDIMGISLNANSTIPITALPVSQVLAMGHAYAAGAFVNTSWSGFLPAGSIIKAHQDGSTVGLSFTNINQLTITKVSN